MSCPAPEPARVLTPSQVVPALLCGCRPLAEAIERYLFDVETLGQGNELPLLVHATKARELFQGWRVVVAQGWPWPVEKAFKLGRKMFLPVRPDDGTPMDDLDFQEYIWERLVTPEGLSELRTILSELGPPVPEAQGPAAPTWGDGLPRDAHSHLTPPARAIAAAYDLKREGKPISLRAACSRAKVDRKHLGENFPEAKKIIETLGKPDCAPTRGIRDRRNRNVDGVYDPEE
jgi:hypothetical protein